MGLKQGGYLLGALFQSALPLLLSSMIVLAAYHIFMGAFFGFAGFTFYFAWYWYLVYFLPVLLTGAFKAIQGTVEFQRESARTNKRKTRDSPYQKCMPKVRMVDENR